MMYSMIAEAKAMPLAAGRCIIERDDMLSMLEDLRDCLPREMEEARRLWEAKEEFIASAKREAEQIRMEAEQKAVKEQIQRSREKLTWPDKAQAVTYVRSLNQKKKALDEAQTLFDSLMQEYFG